MNIIIHTDGGARGNPGPAAIGVVIEQIENRKRKILTTFGKRIGETTNNVAEYTAVVEGLNYLKSQNLNLNDQLKQKNNIQFFLDSNLVVQQLNGRFKVKEPKLRELLTEVRVLEQEVGGVIHYTIVPREQNQRADFLVNDALDHPHVADQL